MSAPAQAPVVTGFDASRAVFESLLARLGADAAGAMQHGELEALLEVEGRELLRVVLQDHLDERAAGEQRIDRVADRDGVARGTAERGHERALGSVFGEVTVGRVAYRQRGLENLHPADAVLNLPAERYSHGLRRLSALEASRGSYQEAAAAIQRGTGQRLGKRQIEQLAARGAVDFEAFYERPERSATQEGAVLVLSCDGKGVVMRPEALRAATAKAAASSSKKLKTRLSKGEKANRKRMAEVGSVFEIMPAPRTTADILPASEQQRAQARPGPVAQNKWLTASVEHGAARVVGEIFTEADRRDPEHQHAWVALVDGNNHQIQQIEAEASARGVTVAVVIDIVHVTEYLWKAAWSFYEEGDPAAEQWVRKQLAQILDGQAAKVAATIRRAATKQRLDPKQRAGADTCAKYLTNKRAYLDYPTALAAGWP